MCAIWSMEEGVKMWQTAGLLYLGYFNCLMWSDSSGKASSLRQDMTWANLRLHSTLLWLWTHCSTGVTNTIEASHFLVWHHVPKEPSCQSRCFLLAAPVESPHRKQYNIKNHDKDVQTLGITINPHHRHPKTLLASTMPICTWPGQSVCVCV